MSLLDRSGCGKEHNGFSFRRCESIVFTLVRYKIWLPAILSSEDTYIRKLVSMIRIFENNKAPNLLTKYATVLNTKTIML